MRIPAVMCHSHCLVLCLAVSVLRASECAAPDNQVDGGLVSPFWKVFHSKPVPNYVLSCACCGQVCVCVCVCVCV